MIHHFMYKKELCHSASSSRKDIISVNHFLCENLVLNGIHFIECKITISAINLGYFNLSFLLQCYIRFCNSCFLIWFRIFIWLYAPSTRGEVIVAAIIPEKNSQITLSINHCLTRRMKSTPFNTHREKPSRHSCGKIHEAIKNEFIKMIIMFT